MIGGFFEEAWPLILSFFHFGLAVSVSLHVVMNRRDPTPALFWIGFIWLLPIVGSTLYGIFGINRVHQKAAHLREFVDPVLDAVSQPYSDATFYGQLEPLARLLNTLVPRSLVGGNAITTLVDGDQVYPAMLEDLDRAERTVCFSSYIFDGSGIGLKFCERFQQLQERGVEVKVIIDDAGTRYSWPSAQRFLRKAGVPVHRFFPRNWALRLLSLNLRNHRKLLIIDGKVGYTGGINVRKGHIVADHPRKGIRDLHFRVEGPVVRQMQQVFAEDWRFCCREVLDDKDVGYYPTLSEKGDAVVCGIADGPDADFMQLELAVTAAVNQACHRISIMTPYFLPMTSLMTGLRLAAMRGVEVDILVPSKNNIPIVHWASQTYYGGLIDRGCRIWESKPPFDHSKILIVDSLFVILGSANMDPRSFRLNFEFNLACFDRNLAVELEDLFDRRKGEAREITTGDLRALGKARQLRNHLARLASPHL